MFSVLMFCENPETNYKRCLNSVKICLVFMILILAYFFFKGQILTGCLACLVLAIGCAFDYVCARQMRGIQNPKELALAYRKGKWVDLLAKLLLVLWFGFLFGWKIGCFFALLVLAVWFLRGVRKGKESKT